MRSRCDERQTDRVARRGRWIGHLITQIFGVLHVIQSGHRLRTALQSRVGCYIRNTFVTEPYFCVALSKTFQILTAGTGAHNSLLK